MALINCSECNAQISDKSATCIKCGAPINAAQQAPATRTNPAVVTTQQTSKKYKLGQAIGSVLVAAGVASCVGDASGATTPVLLLSGLAIYFGSVLAAWWNHG